MPYRTTPAPSTNMPGGIPYIVVNEAAERFSFYGMRTILYVFMTKNLLSAAGTPAPLGDLEAREAFHLFVFAVYFLPILGAILSDALLGKYRTILWLSVVYCLGHLALAVDETRLGLWTGLSLIALGSGGIKPCVAAHVGDQFGTLNQNLIGRVYYWFYFAVNLGSAISTFLTPWLLENKNYGPHWAFGVPGVLMFLATVAFWLGRNKFVHVPPAGWGFVRETFSGDGRRALVHMTGIVLFAAMFWSLYDQTSSTWVEQAEHMDRNFAGHTWLASQVQAVNPVLIMIFVPLFAYVVYPAIERVWALTPLRKIGLGLFLTVAAFAVPWWVQVRIDAGAEPSIGWQMLAYVLITAAEMMVSVTCLEFFYTQAPKRMKSVVMSIDLLAVAIGNLFTALVNRAIILPDGKSRLEGATYYAFFTAAMLATAVGFVVYSQFYRGKTYIQGDE